MLNIGRTEMISLSLRFACWREREQEHELIALSLTGLRVAGPSALKPIADRNLVTGVAKITINIV